MPLPPPPAAARLAPLALLLAPAGLLAWAGPDPLGRAMFDLHGHLWMIWNTHQGWLTGSTMLGHPEGVDLLPVVGGWADVLLGGLLATVLPLAVAWNVVVCLYVLVAGLGGYALARVAGARPAAAALAGLLTQLSPLLVDSLNWGRAEQVGLGFPALALAGAVHTWRHPSWRPAVATGLAGAAVVYVSWEYALLLALFTAALLPVLAWSSRAPAIEPQPSPQQPSPPQPSPPLSASLRAHALAAATTALVAGPWVALFLHRSLAVRHGDEADFAAWATARNAVVLAEWLHAAPTGPSLPLLACLLAAPFLVRRVDRRLALGVLLGLGATLLLALGPEPRLRSAADPPTPALALFGHLHQLPVLRWFHWPDRYLLAWALALPVAGAITVQALGRRSRLAALLLALGLLGSGAHRLWRTGGWPEHGVAPVAPTPLLALRDIEAPGAVLDLPLPPDITLTQRYQLAQLVHGRPIFTHGTMEHLLPRDHLAWAEDTGLYSWLGRLSGPDEPPALRRADFDAFAARGYRFVTWSAILPDPAGQRGWQGLWQALGEPLIALDAWTLWWLPVEGEQRPERPEVRWEAGTPVLVFPPKHGAEVRAAAYAPLPAGGQGSAPGQAGAVAPTPGEGVGVEQGAVEEGAAADPRAEADQRHRDRPRPRSRRDP